MAPTAPVQMPGGDRDMSDKNKKKKVELSAEQTALQGQVRELEGLVGQQNQDERAPSLADAPPDSKGHLSAIFDAIQAGAMGCYIVDTDRRILRWNKGAEKITGYSAQEAVGRCCADLLSIGDKDGNSVCMHSCPMLRAFGERKSIVSRDTELCFTHKDGRRLLIEPSVSPIIGEDGEVTGGIKVFVDLSERERFNQERNALMEKLRDLSMTDELTGLPNRRQLMARLDEEMSRSERTGHPFALLMMDLDYFKHVNDQYGHQKGDEVLRKCAITLEQNLRGMDFAGRYGGDEFCVLVSETSPAGARRVAEKLRESLKKPRGALPTVSIGLAFWAPYCSVHDVIKRADAALYDAKHAGRDQVVVWRDIASEREKADD